VRLPESDQELREFLDQASIGLRWMGPDGRILWANTAELKMVGCSEQEYVGRNIAEFLEVARFLSIFHSSERETETEVKRTKIFTRRAVWIPSIIEPDRTDR